ncbi:unnamed protein product [Nesidiocoris tenuis]|uniref:Fatty acyl-CoA reductase n=1 Tax=Nesidiocoris tenuis TaxID=355587 RepID=A0A6H5GF21_9HEMI|nr:unnamed protein product [Nesidiocoris tenuis]
MAAHTTESEIVDFYRDKTIFITGGSGFIGRILIEHLFRKCEVQKIFVLVRAKKGVEPKDRKQTIFNVELFDKLRALKPNFLDSIVFVEGNVSQLNLGIDESARATLANEVQIVFHTAATVKLEANLKEATAINILGTREMCRLCSKFKNLEAFVHVSTAYSHCVRPEIGEEIYDVPTTADKLIKITESLTEKEVADITDKLLYGWPNTYTLTKAVAENILKSYVDRMPMCVVRPGLVISTKEDPIKGWVDNVYGPIGFVAGTAAGVLKVSYVDPDAKTEFVPADIVVNTLIAAGARTGRKTSHPEITIYNVVTDPENPITYREFNKITTNLGHENPPHFAVWYFTHTCIKNRLLYLLAAFFFHKLPAMLIDGFLLLIGKKPKLMKIFNKIHMFLDSVSFVALHTWKFDTTNVQKMLAELNEVDRKNFNFDMSARNINWKKMLEISTCGITFYLFKENLLKSDEKAKKRYFWLHILHRFTQGFYLVFFYYLIKTIVWTTVFLYTATLDGTRHLVCNPSICQC